MILEISLSVGGFRMLHRDRAVTGRFHAWHWLPLAWVSILVCSASLSTRAEISPAAPPEGLADPGRPAPPAPAVAEVYEWFQGTVFSLVTRTRGQSAIVSHGTAFVLNPSGVLATSYHVVARAALDPDRYELILRRPTGPVHATVTAIDIANDLALVGVPADFHAALPLAPSTRALAGGERVFSIGVPGSLALSIVPANLTGYLATSRGRALVTSSPLSAGMSGGPTVNASGEVIGINRAASRPAQSLSFLSDAEALARLVEAASGGESVPGGGFSRSPASNSPVDWKKEVERQERDIEEDLVQSLGGGTAVTVRMGSVRYGNLPPASLCGAGRIGDPGTPARLDETSCRSFTLASADGRHPVCRIRALLLGLGAARRPARQELFSDARVAAAGRRLFRDALRDRAEFTRPDCDERLVQNRNGVRVRVAFCTTRFRRFGHLYRVLAKIGAYDGVRNRDLAILDLSGFSGEGVSRLVDYYVNSIEKIGGAAGGDP